MSIEANSENGKVKLDPSQKHIIEFRNVWFKYPGNNEYILKGINLIIKNGEKLSIVGANGAGKSTFIKLLCGLYKVDKGEILVDNKKINYFNFQDLSKLYSVGFKILKFLLLRLEKILVLVSNMMKKRSKI